MPRQLLMKELTYCILGATVHFYGRHQRQKVQGRIQRISW